MKRILGLMLILCLTLGCIAPASAAKKVKILRQPQTQTVKAGGKVTFSFKAENNNVITWYLVNPETGEKIAASKISSVFKGVRVGGQNSWTLTIKRVTSDMHGWGVFARAGIDRTHYTDTDTVQLLIKGMATDSTGAETSEEGDTADDGAEQQGEDEDDGGSADKAKPVNEGDTAQKGEDATQEGEDAAPAGDTQIADTQTEAGDAAATAENAEAAKPEEPEEDPDESDQEIDKDYVPEDINPDEINITANNALLFELDEEGNPIGEGATSLTFMKVANFFVKLNKEGEFQYWSINGARFLLGESLTSFTLRDVKESMSISAKVQSASLATIEAALNRDQMCTITCTNCTFTYLLDGIVQQTSGQVPAGAIIRVIAGDPDNAAGRKFVIGKGYSINGGEPEYQEKASFNLTVTGDTTIEMLTK